MKSLMLGFEKMFLVKHLVFYLKSDANLVSGAFWQILIHTEYDGPRVTCVFSPLLYVKHAFELQLPVSLYLQFLV